MRTRTPASICAPLLLLLVGQADRSDAAFTFVPTGAGATVTGDGSNEVFRVTVSLVPTLGDPPFVTVLAHNRAGDPGIDSAVDWDSTPGFVGILPAAATTQVTISGGGGNDTIILGSGAIPANQLLAEFTVAGGGGSDALQLDLSGAPAVSLVVRAGEISSTNLQVILATGAAPGGATARFSNGIEITTGAGNDNVVVQGVAFSQPVRLLLGLGEDSVTAGGFGGLSDLLDFVTVDGGPGGDRVSLSDIPALSGGSFEVGTASARRLGVTGTAGFAFSNVTDVALSASTFADTIDVLGVAPGTTLQIYGKAGDDTITIGAGGAWDTVQGAVYVFGEAGVDALNVFDTAASLARVVNVSQSADGCGPGVPSLVFARAGTPTTSTVACDVEAGSLALGSGGDTVTVGGTPLGFQLQLSTGSGDDAVTVGSFDVGADFARIGGVVQVLGQGGNDSLLLNDSEATAARTYTQDNFFGTRLSASGLPGAVIYDTSMERTRLQTSQSAPSTVIVQYAARALDVQGGNANDQFIVDSNGAAAGGTLNGVNATVTFDGVGGSDVLTLNDGGESVGNVFTTSTASGATDVFTATGTPLFASLSGRVRFTRLATVLVDLGTGPDIATITALPATTWKLTGGSGPGDLLNVLAGCRELRPLSSPIVFPGAAEIQHSGFEDVSIADTLTPTPFTLSFSPFGGIATSSVTTTAACTWSVTSSAPWLIVDSGGAPRSGNGGFSFHLLGNFSNGGDRTATLTVGGNTYLVRQSGEIVITSIDPTSGPSAGGTNVTLHGANFGASTPLVTFGGTSALVQRLDGNRLRAIAPPGVAGTTVAVLATAAEGGPASTPRSFTYVAAPTDASTDSDGDGMPDSWEIRYSLDPLVNDAGLDPDGDGVTSLGEFAADTHPRGFYTRYLAEGASSAFFTTQIALLNVNEAPSATLVRYLTSSGGVQTVFRSIPPITRFTELPAAQFGAVPTEFSTVVESDVEIVVDRTMTWDASGYGSHAETAVVAPATTWYLAEGSTVGSFDLFYLLQNATATTANVEVTYLRPAPAAPVVRNYSVGPRSRFNIWVNTEGPELAATDVSAVVRVTNAVPIIVERAMYLSRPGQPFGAGHESAGVTAPRLEWFLAEGATGSYFDLFVLVANPSASDAEVTATYLLPDGTTIERSYGVPANSRFNIWVDLEDDRLADTAVSTRVRVTNGVPVIVERAMWWPGPTSASWHEAHNSAGATATGAVWALAEGEVGGSRTAETYVLMANTSPFAATASVVILFEDGTLDSRDFPLAANSRFTVDVRTEFPSALNRRFGTLVVGNSAAGAPALVVERAMYTSAGGVTWAAGTNSLGVLVER